MNFFAGAPINLPVPAMQPDVTFSGCRATVRRRFESLGPSAL
ncbi:hypothetical protein [Kamptonema formosum]|nr:hypothetical protein [Oscillatoria sp. PCC 10802]